jgi:hypothetical protein
MKRGVDLISDALPFGRLWYDEPNAVANAIGYDESGNVIETHEHAGDFQRLNVLALARSEFL